jgi:hypothetical protein
MTDRSFLRMLLKSLPELFSHEGRGIGYRYRSTLRDYLLSIVRPLHSRPSRALCEVSIYAGVLLRRSDLPPLLDRFDFSLELLSFR